MKIIKKAFTPLWVAMYFIPIGLFTFYMVQNHTTSTLQAVNVSDTSTNIPDCGSISFQGLVNAPDNVRTASEEKVFACIVASLTNCSPSSFDEEHSISDLRPTKYTVHGLNGQTCTISRTNSISKTSPIPQSQVPIETCHVPVNYINEQFAEQKTKFNTTDPTGAVLSLLGIIDSAGILTDGVTGQTKQVFVCQ